MMKQLIKVLIVFGLISGGCAYAGWGEHKNKKTTCLIYKNDKVTYKGSCLYDHTYASAAGEGEADRNFTIKNHGKFNVYEKWYWNSNVERDITEYKLNKKKVDLQYRDAGTLKILTPLEIEWYEEQHHEKAGSAKQAEWFTCHKYQPTKLEFCYIRQ